MKAWLNISIAVLTLVGCSLYGEKREKTFTAREVNRENVFSFGTVNVKINPDLAYMNISGKIKIEIMGKLSTPTKREFHIFTRPGLDDMVLIETHTRNPPHTFEQHKDLTKNMITIQKGKKPIDGKIWEVYTRAHPQFPEQILSAVKQEGIQIEPYRCGLEIGVARVINRFDRIYVSYIKGFDECQDLPQNESVLSDNQIQMLRELAKQFDTIITISDQSGG